MKKPNTKKSKLKPTINDKKRVLSCSKKLNIELRLTVNKDSGVAIRGEIFRSLVPSNTAWVEMVPALGNLSNPSSAYIHGAACDTVILRALNGPNPEYAYTARFWADDIEHAAPLIFTASAIGGITVNLDNSRSKDGIAVLFEGDKGPLGTPRIVGAGTKGTASMNAKKVIISPILGRFQHVALNLIMESCLVC